MGSRLSWPLAALISALCARAAAELAITPAEVVLRGGDARQQITVTGARTVDGTSCAADLTREAVFRTETPGVVSVDAHGVVTPLSDGVGTVVAAAGCEEARAFVLVVEADRRPPPSFELDVEAVLARAGCNSGPCHGKARGQNGFQLSLLGFDPGFDHRAITRDLAGRRVSPEEPEKSLVLRKPSAEIPHGGGKRLERGSAGYETLRRWIALGMPLRAEAEPALERITVEPGDRVLAARSLQQLIVTAHFVDRSRRDVTALATFLSSESVIASVDEHGLVKAGPIPGDVAIMARFLGKIATASISIPLSGKVPPELHARLPRRNFIDDLVWKKLERLGITPSEPASDAAFLRRAHIDLIGRLPVPAETSAFLADTTADKRERLVDRLLERPEYADHWAGKWADLLRPNPYRVGIKAVWNLDAWLRESFRENKPYDRFVREIVTAQGSTFHAGAATVFRDRRSPDEIAPMVSQLFLGIRLECAKCHHHPFEVYGQDDFFSLAAYFARVGYKGTGLSPPISGSEEIVFTAPSGSVKHPRTGAELAPRPLFGKAPPLDPARDPREALADWMLSEERSSFARAIANRVWADLMGIGLVEPVDDLRATNPPSNGPLLDALAADFKKNGCDLKKLLRTILTSHVYGLASKPGDRNAADTRNYSRHYRQRLRAEVLVDAVSDITQVSETFAALPPGSRAAEIWTHRTESFSLDAFGRPDPNQDPPCQRTTDTSLVQALHLMNSPGFHAKVTSDSGRAARLASSGRSAQEIVEELYLLAYSRFPSPPEREAAAHLLGEKRETWRGACEDLLWALLNTPEFVFKD